VEIREKYDIDRIFRLVLTVFIAGLMFSLIYYLRTILIQFVIAFIIAYLLDPIVDVLENLRIPRVVSILIVFIFIGLIFFVLIFYGFPYVYSEFYTFGQVFPKYIQNIYNFIQSKISVLSQQQPASESFNTYLEKIIENIEASQFIDRILRYISNIFSQLLNLIYLLIALVIIVMYVFFLLRDIDRIKERWQYYIPDKYRITIQVFLQDVHFYTTRFFRGQLTIVFILGILFSIGFSIVDIRLAIIFGFTAGLMNFIPNFGTVTAIFPAVLLAVGRAAEDGSDPWMRIFGVLLVFLIVQITQDLILTPTIMGKRTGLRPATILFSVLIWGKLLGFLGIILAIPLTCLTKVYFARFILKEEISPTISKTGEKDVSKEI